MRIPLILFLCGGLGFAGSAGLAFASVPSSPSLSAGRGHADYLFPTSIPAHSRFAALYQKALDFFRLRTQPGQIEHSLTTYDAILSQDPGQIEALCRAAQCCYWLGNEAAKERQAEFYEQGLRYAKRAVDENPKHPEAQFWYGLLLGCASLSRPNLNSLTVVDKVIHAMEEVIRLDPMEGFAYHVLGLIYREAPAWPLSKGDLNKSLHYARQAVARQPDVVLPYLGLAETLMAMKRTPEARSTLQTALHLPGPRDYQPETKKEKARARELLAKLATGQPRR